MTGPQGLLDGSADRSGHVVVGLDVQRHRFLRDHEVGGRALLSTVMGVETMAVALRHARPGARIVAVGHLQVGPPYLLPAGGRGSVTVELAGTSTIRCTVRSGAADVHFIADLDLAPGDGVPVTLLDDPPPVRGPLTVRGELVYGLYFHGPSFRVVDEAWLDGTTMTARLRRDRPAAVGGGRRSLTAPLLVELCLQTAGLYDLAMHDAMTIPHRIEHIRRFSPVDADGPGELYAVVRPVTDAVGPRFDARVVDDAGHVHVTVDGYRTAPFGHPHDLAAADRIRRALGSGSVRREQRPGLG